MELKYTHTRLLVRDFAACFRFYKDVLGLTPAFRTAEDIYAEFDTGTAILALYRRDLMAGVVGTDGLPAEATMQDRVALTFDAANVDETYLELSERGVQFLAAPADKPEWMIRVAHFRDPDGNLLEINSPLKTDQG